MKLWAAFQFFTRHRLRWGTTVAVRWAQFAVSAGIFGAALSQLVTGVPEYVLYYAIGLIAAGIFGSVTIAGTDLLSDAQYGVDEYYLALPVPRRTLYIARIVASGFTSFIFIGVPALALLGVAGRLTIPGSLAIIGLAFGAGTGLAGLGLAIAALSRDFEGFLVINSFFDSFLIRLSTAFYPLAAMPRLFQIIAAYNPISQFAWLGHRIFGHPAGSDSSWRLSLLILGVSIVISLVSGDALFRRRLQGRLR